MTQQLAPGRVRPQADIPAGLQALAQIVSQSIRQLRPGHPQSRCRLRHRLTQLRHGRCHRPWTRRLAEVLAALYWVVVPDLNTARKKRRGIFYTPGELSAALTSWAVRGPSDTVLEPGFGQCVFLDAIADRLVKLQAQEPAKLVYGCDVQKRALSNTPAVLRRDGWHDHFVHADFLKLTPASFGGTEFDVVMGNPPYVSRHNMYHSQHRAAAAVCEDDEFRLPLSASLWAFFVFHALRFLRVGGRMAWVLPASAVGAFRRALRSFRACHGSFPPRKAV